MATYKVNLFHLHKKTPQMHGQKKRIKKQLINQIPLEIQGAGSWNICKLVITLVRFPILDPAKKKLNQDYCCIYILAVDHKSLCFI